MPARSKSKLTNVLSRRGFIALFPAALAGSTLLTRNSLARELITAADKSNSCWLDVCAPLVIDDPEIGLHSEIFLTSDTFVGAKGYDDGADTTEYEICLYDSTGKAIGADGVTRRLVVPAMHTTVLKVRELLGDNKAFWGGMRIRLRPKGREPMHASDLFSSAFVRWKSDKSFDNVHANPDPLQWQKPDPFFYSMPFPPLGEYEAMFSLFNPYAEPSTGMLTVYDELGGKLRETSYELKPRSSLLFDLRQGEFSSSPRPTLSPDFRSTNHKASLLTSRGGTIAVTNQKGSPKGFAYLMLKRAGGVRFSVEHPIHQAPFKAAPAPPPFDAAGRFKAKNILYTPLLFRSKRLGNLTLDSRFHLSSGAPIEEHLWISPFITDSSGNVAWQITPEIRLPESISPKQIERDVIKLGPMQSCMMAAADLKLPQSFGGGLSLALAPTTNHTLMKVEVSVKEWGAHAFTHFRPGLQSARGYQTSKARGTLATDYIACGARLEKTGGRMVRDEVIGIINIDDKGIAGRPALEVFAAGGLVGRFELGEVPGFACRHYLLSELSFEKIGAQDLTLRLVDERATLLMSVVHLDYTRRDLALDHGSDRFSTFNDYSCDATG